MKEVVGSHVSSLFQHATLSGDTQVGDSAIF